MSGGVAPTAEPKPGFYPPPGGRARLLALGAILGGALWPLALFDYSISIGETCGPAGCSLAEANALTLAASVVLIALGVAGLELRPRAQLGLVDLIGDLTIGVAAALFTVSALLRAPVFLGSAFLLLLLGGVIWGVEGFRHQARPRWPSILVAIGSGGVLAFAILGGLVGPAAAGSLDQTVVLGILLFAAGWVWLGVDLLLGRPLPIQPSAPNGGGVGGR
jgi:hypothetical protein